MGLDVVLGLVLVRVLDALAGRVLVVLDLVHLAPLRSESEVAFLLPSLSLGWVGCVAATMRAAA